MIGVAGISVEETSVGEASNPPPLDDAWTFTSSVDLATTWGFIADSLLTGNLGRDSQRTLRRTTCQ